jgi:hypothetical protein
MKAPITLEELLTELAKAENASRAQRDGWSTQELAKAWSVSLDVARRRLQMAFNNGWARCVGRGARTNIAGERCLVPIYRIDAPQSVAKPRRKAAAKKRGR